MYFFGGLFAHIPEALPEIFVFVTGVRDKDRVGKTVQAGRNPVGAVSVEIEFRITQIIPLFNLRENFVPDVFRFLLIRADRKDADAFSAFSAFGNSFVYAHKRDNRTLCAPKRHRSSSASIWRTLTFRASCSGVGGT